MVSHGDLDHQTIGREPRPLGFLQPTAGECPQKRSAAHACARVGLGVEKKKKRTESVPLTHLIGVPGVVRCWEYGLEAGKPPGR